MQATQLNVFFEQIQQQLTIVPDEVRRLFHGRGCCFTGLEQLTCDWLQGALIVNLYKPVDELFFNQLKVGLIALSQSSVWSDKGGKAILIQHRYSEGAPSELLLGELESDPIVVENGLKYRLTLARNQNFGLFLDMRYGRQWVKQHAQNKKVLNLFAYTCGFSVAAIEGGAHRVVNVDMAKSSLSRGRDNHRLNGHDMKKVSFLGHDIFKSWGKINKAGCYDLIIIDPPSFQKGSFALTKDYQKILRRLPQLLTPQGVVLACVNSPNVTPDFLIESMRVEAPTVQFMQRLDNPPEFVDIDQNSSLKVLIFCNQPS